MAFSRSVLVKILLAFWCQPFTIVSLDKLVVHHYDSNNRYRPEESHIAMEHEGGRMQDILKPCGDNLCLCSKIEAHCVNQSRKLSYIPKLPTTIKHLNFSFNYLPHLDDTTFSNLTSLNLIHISLEGNMLKSCSSKAFGTLKHLLKIVIHNERLASDSLKRCLGSINAKRLDTIYLLDLKIIGFKSDLFSEMKTSSLREINMGGSKMRIYNQSAFSHLTKLEILVLSNCNIRYVIVDKAPKLKWLTLSNNFLSEIPDFCKNGRELYPRLTSLSLNRNKISTIQQNRLECLKSLKNLTLSNNNIVTVEPNTFSRIPNLHGIFLEFNSQRGMVIKANAFNSSSLTHLYLRGNHVYLTKQLSVDAFKECTNLRVLHLEQNKLQLDGNGQNFDAVFQRLLGSLSNLEELNLVRTEIQKLPNVIPQIMYKLKYLFAHTNFISQWPADYFHNLTHLRKLDLKQNKISVINKTSFSEKNLRSLKQIGFADNPFSCRCDLLWFLDYLKTDNNSRKFEYYPYVYKCNYPPELQGIKLKDVPLNDRICLEIQISSYIISVSATLLVLVACISCVYRHRWKLRYLVYLVRFQTNRYQRMQENDGNLYDLYLSSSEDDFDFILEHIIPKLEKGLGLKLYIPQRDGIGYKVDTIVSNMDVSKKALLFVSDSYVQDQYCQLEATIAFDRYVTRRRNMMIVVLLKELQTVSVNKTINKIINVDEYIMWSDADENVHMFWRKLKNAIQANDDLRC